MTQEPQLQLPRTLNAVEELVRAVVSAQRANGSDAAIAELFSTLDHVRSTADEEIEQWQDLHHDWAVDALSCPGCHEWHCECAVQEAAQ